MFLMKRFFTYKLFTPGPLTTSLSVKGAMANDQGSSKEFYNIAGAIKSNLIKISKLSPELYTSILLPGSGTFGVEAALRTAVSTSEKVLIVSNGAYGERMIKICSILKIPYKVLKYDERQKVKLDDVVDCISENTDVTSMAIVHSETTTGILNPIEEISKKIKEKFPHIVVIGDCVSSFGAVDIDFSSIDFIVTCSNKLLQGVPGLGIVLANKDILRSCQGKSRSAFLDLYRISQHPDHFLCLPPYQAVLGLRRAIEEFWIEGGVEARQLRYQKNQQYLKQEMEKMGFELYIAQEDQGWIISTFIEPTHPNYSFEVFYQHLAQNNIIIYPGKVSKFPTFRIGTIGELYEKDMKACVESIKRAFIDMNISLPLKPSNN
jgi:2-aminoethylphosphonate-pyruvate transaminase